MEYQKLQTTFNQIAAWPSIYEKTMAEDGEIELRASSRKGRRSQKKDNKKACIQARIDNNN